MLPVTGFFISSRSSPMAIFAADLAIGYPVAFDARADERLTLGLTSMTMYSKLSGSRANCILQPPFIPRALMILSEELLSI